MPSWRPASRNASMLMNSPAASATLKKTKPMRHAIFLGRRGNVPGDEAGGAEGSRIGLYGRFDLTEHGRRSRLVSHFASEHRYGLRGLRAEASAKMPIGLTVSVKEDPSALAWSHGSHWPPAG